MGRKAWSHQCYRAESQLAAGIIYMPKDPWDKGDFQGSETAYIYRCSVAAAAFGQDDEHRNDNVSEAAQLLEVSHKA